MTPLIDGGHGAVAPCPPYKTTKLIGRKGRVMSNVSSLSDSELDDRIAIIRDNIRQLIEQAAGASGGQNEERTADRISQQNEELEKLTKERDSRAKK
jgi:hypothetical protein